MNLEQIMTSGVWTVTPDHTIRQAAELMRDLDIGFLAVIADGEAVGVVTDRDITVRAAATGRPPTTTVEKIMSAPALFCHLDREPGHAARVMAEHQVRRLLVYERRGELAGVVTLSDLALSLGNADLSTEILQEISKAPIAPQ